MNEHKKVLQGAVPQSDFLAELAAQGVVIDPNSIVYTMQVKTSVSKPGTKNEIACGSVACLAKQYQFKAGVAAAVGEQIGSVAITDYSRRRQHRKTGTLTRWSMHDLGIVTLPSLFRRMFIHRLTLQPNPALHLSQPDQNQNETL